MEVDEHNKVFVSDIEYIQSGVLVQEVDIRHIHNHILCVHIPHLPYHYRLHLCGLLIQKQEVPIRVAHLGAQDSMLADIHYSIYTLTR